MGYWAKTNAKLLTVSVGDSGHVWGINASYDVFRKPSTGKWDLIPLPDGVETKCVSVGSDGHCLMCDSQTQIIYRWDLEGEQWQKFESGRFFKLDVANNGQIAGISYDAKVYKYLNDLKFYDTKNLEDSKKQLQAIAVSIGDDGNILIIDHSGRVYRWNRPPFNEPGDYYTDISGILIRPGVNRVVKHISIANESMIMAVTSEEKIYRYIGEMKWAPIPFCDINGNGLATPGGNEIIDFSTGSDGTMMAVTSDYSVYTYIPIDPPSTTS